MTFQPQKDNLIKTFEENIQANIESISLNETSIIESQEIIDNFTPFCEDIDKKILTIRNNINSIKSEIVQIYKQSFSVGCGTTLGATQIYPDTSVDYFYNISYVEYNGDEPYEKLYQDLNSFNVGFGTFLVYTEDNSSVTGLGSAYSNTQLCYKFPCNSAICESYNSQIQQKNLEILGLRNQLIDLIPSVNSLKTERITYQIRRWADNHTISLCRQENERLSIAIRVLNGYETQTDLDDNNIAINIVTDGLLLNLDASNLNSYPGFGDTWFDISGNGNHATRTNNAGFGGQVAYNSAGYFDYSVNTPDGIGGGTALSGNGFTMSNVVVPTTGGFSLSAFIRRNTSVKAGGDRETIFSNTADEYGWRFGIYTNSNGDALGSLYYLIGGDGGVGYQEGSLGGNTLLDGNWHMITAVFDRAATLGSYTVYGYIDGVASGSETISAGAAGNVAFPTFLPGVGYRGCCDVFAGQIATVSAYNRVLTAAEIQQNYNALKGRFGLT